MFNNLHLRQDDSPVNRKSLKGHRKFGQIAVKQGELIINL